jgi:hypothetical protein
MRRRTVGIICAGAGFGLWLVPLSLLGREPWDVSPGGYVLVLAAAGAAGIRLAWPARAGDVWRWPGCIVLGEWLFMLTQPDRWSLWPLALVGLAIFGLPAVLGAWLARLVLRRLRPS